MAAPAEHAHHDCSDQHVDAEDDYRERDLVTAEVERVADQIEAAAQRQHNADVLPGAASHVAFGPSPLLGAVADCSVPDLSPVPIAASVTSSSFER